MDHHGHHARTDGWRISVSPGCAGGAVAADYDYAYNMTQVFHQSPTGPVYGRRRQMQLSKICGVARPSTDSAAEQEPVLRTALSPCPPIH